MNLPNKLTIFRVILIPLFVIILLMDIGKTGDYIALGIFILASITDFFDGFYARRHNLVTNFGKFMDPLADKMLICSAGICLVSLGRLSAWVLIVLLVREFCISGFRLVAASENIVISASYWGKVKTVVQMVMIGALILDLDFVWWKIFEQVLVYASVVLCLISLFDYIWKNRQILTENDKNTV